MTEVITPQEAIAQDGDQMFVDRIISEVNSCIKRREFHYNSSRSNWFVINVNSYNHDDEILSKVVDELKSKGWDAQYDSGYCGHGPFMCIKIKTNEYNPQTIKYKQTQ
jgi:hypothetical protein